MYLVIQSMGKRTTSIRISEEVLDAGKEYVERERGEGEFSGFVEDLLVTYLNAQDNRNFQEFGVAEEQFTELRTHLTATREAVDAVEDALYENNVLGDNETDNSAKGGERTGSSWTNDDRDE
jgi:hypothetical protein